MDKKAWEKPALIVLSRGNPEESVLDECKNSQQQGPTTVGFSCVCPVAGCAACDVVTVS